MMRVFIADDEEIIRDGIRNCIEKEQERFLFAGEAPDGEMALPMLMEMKPDVLITDIRMPFMDGLELAKVVRRTMPWLRIVFLSGHDEFEYAQKAVSLHADAYLLVNATPVGMYPNNGECLVHLDALPKLAGVMDLIYNPARTALILRAVPSRSTPRRISFRSQKSVSRSRYIRRIR